MLDRFEDARTSTIVGKFGEPTGAFELGERDRARGGLGVWTVLQTGLPARVDGYDELPRPGRRRAARARVPLGVGRADHASPASRGARSSSPSAQARELPVETERRLRGSSPSSSRSRSRARRRATSSPPRGCASSRRATPSGAGSSATSTTARSSGWSALSLGLRLARRKIRDAPGRGRGAARGDRRRAVARRSPSLRELAQGIHPAVLTERGLGAALEVLAARTPLPVALDVRLAAAPARADRGGRVLRRLRGARERRQARRGRLGARAGRAPRRAAREIEVADDGTGAPTPTGSGLRGLRDRVETLDGRLHDRELAGRRDARPRRASRAARALRRWAGDR